MAQQDFFEQLSELDPYDREDRCRKAIRTLLKAVLMRAAAGVLLTVAVLRAGAAPIALGLAAFALLVILAGLLPLVRELQKQFHLLKDCVAQQKEMENSKQSE